MACVKEQTLFLCHLWAHLIPDEDLKLAFKVLLNRGKILDLLDTSKDELLMIAYACVTAGREIGSGLG